MKKMHFFIMPCSEQLTVFIYEDNAYLIDYINLYLVGGCLFEGGMCQGCLPLALDYANKVIEFNYHAFKIT
jgi:hypothetical protein